MGELGGVQPASDGQPWEGKGLGGGELVLTETDRGSKHVYECGWTDPFVNPAQLQRSPSPIRGAERIAGEQARSMPTSP